MIFKDSDGDLWRFSAKRNQLEVKLTLEGTGTDDLGERADEDWAPLSFENDEEMESFWRVSFPDSHKELMEIVKKCRENPESDDTSSITEGDPR